MKSSRVPVEARLSEIRSALRESSSVSIAEMSARLGVSEMTIRRDLDRLQNLADLRRTHGGAVLADRMVFEFNYRSRQRQNLPEKQAIAAKARSLVKPGQSVILDTGTTTFQLARLLKDCDGCKVITPSLAVASELQYRENLSVILLGGVIHRGSPDLTGPVTLHGLDLFSADWLFQGAEAVGPDGAIYNIDLQLAEVDRKMRLKTARKCLLVDGSKFMKTALVQTGSLSDFDFVVTNSGAPHKALLLAKKMAGRVFSV